MFKKVNAVMPATVQKALDYPDGVVALCKNWDKLFTFLPGSDPVCMAVTADAVQELIDGVDRHRRLAITAVTAGLPVAVRLTDGQLRDANLALAEKLSRYYSQQSVRGLAFRTVIRQYSVKNVRKTAHIIARDVCDYGNAGGRETKRIAAVLRALLEKCRMTPPWAKVITSRAVHNADEMPSDDCPVEALHLTVTLYVNMADGKGVVFYMKEGRV